jgi:hypothetical protein
MLPYLRPLCFLHFQLQSTKQLVSFSIHIPFIAPLQHRHNNFRIVHTLQLNYFLKREIPFLAVWLDRQSVFLMDLQHCHIQDCLLLAIHSLHIQTIVSFISTYQTFQSVIQHLKRVLTIVPISMATFILNASLQVALFFKFVTLYDPFLAMGCWNLTNLFLIWFIHFLSFLQ